jgi:hypothetical protein
MTQTDVDRFVADIDAILRKHGGNPAGDELIRQTVTRYGRETATAGLARLKGQVAADADDRRRVQGAAATFLNHFLAR